MNEMASTTAYREAINYLSTFQFHGFKLGIERIEAISEALGTPHEKYPCIHVAGTNGKGSVCAFLESILTRSGLKVGLYTSPHLFRLEERFRVGGSNITPERLSQLIMKIRKLVEAGYELSYFEYTTAISMLWFAEEGVDIAIFETGLGGRLDATNIVRPMISVITNVSLEHQAFLGPTIGDIAGEKAGIIKEGGLVVTAACHPDAQSVIEARAREAGARLFILGKDFHFHSKGCRNMDFGGHGLFLEDLSIGLIGAHQMENASLALMTCNLLRDCFNLSITDDAIRNGLESVNWPGRGEVRSTSRGTVLFDGAHNEAGIKALDDLLEVLDTGTGFSHMLLLWAMSDEGGDKDYVSLLRLIGDRFHEIIVTEPPGPRRPVTIEQWRQTSPALNIQYEKMWDQALSKALSLMKQDSLLVVAGSLYLVGACRELIDKISS